MIWYCGVDWGKSCAMTFLSDDGRACDCFLMPMFKDKGRRQYDGLGMRELFERYHPVMTIFEKAYAGQGRATCLSMGLGAGLTEGILIGLKLPHRSVRPQEWKNIILKGTKKDKSDAIVWCRGAFPKVDLRATPKCKKMHDGKADSICIAQFCRWQEKGVSQ